MAVQAREKSHPIVDFRQRDYPTHCAQILLKQN